jgi:hypothetical protein
LSDRIVDPTVSRLDASGEQTVSPERPVSIHANGPEITGHQTAAAADTIDQRALAHRVLAIELVDPSTTPAAKAQISSALRWRDACDARQLVVNMLVQHADGLAEVEQVVRHVDATACPYRDRPTLRVYCILPQDIESLVGQLATADTRTPRIEVIRVLDPPLKPQRLAQLMREAASAESALLQFWAYLELSSTRELAQLADLLSDRDFGPPGQPAFRRFPIVEVPGSFSIDDAEPIAEFWSQHPRVQEASTRSLHGRVETFFRFFELARLARVGVELPHSSSDVGPDDYRCLSAFHTWLDRSGLLTTEPHLGNAIIEHDVDLLADSHECQSPVFTFAGVSTHVDAVRSSGGAL